jgi:hypothetical protein
VDGGWRSNIVRQAHEVFQTDEMVVAFDPTVLRAPQDDPETGDKKEHDEEEELRPYERPRRQLTTNPCLASKTPVMLAAETQPPTR